MGLSSWSGLSVMDERIHEIPITLRLELRSPMRLALGTYRVEVVKPFVCLLPIRVVDLNKMNGVFSLCPDILLVMASIKQPSLNILMSSEI